MPSRETQRHRPLGWGESAPWFTVRADCNPTFSFNTAAGRCAVLVFFQSAALPESRRALEPALCRALVEFYDRGGGEPSGFMRDIDGRTRLVHDAQHKVRRDREITDQALPGGAMARIHARLVPEIAKAFQFHVTRIERHIVAWYDGSDRGHFRPHRDNTTKGTAHRRFAVTLNLNAGEYDGGNLRFPEFGPQTYRPPTGAALVFSCSLLHEATDVTRGRRYAYLPFLYDDAAAAVRAANLDFLATGPASDLSSTDTR